LSVFCPVHSACRLVLLRFAYYQLTVVILFAFTPAYPLNTSEPLINTHDSTGYSRDSIVVTSSGMHESRIQAVPELERIKVTGRRLSSYAVSTKSLEAASFSGRYSNLGDLLNTVSGISIFKTGGLGAYSEMSIRGSGSNQVQVYLDGLPLNTASGGAVDIAKIPLGMLQKVTVYKSTAPLELSGRNAGGVVELNSEPKAKKTILTGLAESGSYGYLKGGALFAKSGLKSKHRISIDAAQCNNNYPYEFNPTPYEDGDELIKVADNRDYESASGIYSNKIAFDSGGMSLSSHIAVDYFKKGLFNYATPGKNDGYTRDYGLTVIEKYEATLNDVLLITGKLSGKNKWNTFTRENPFYIATPRHRETTYPFAEGILTCLLTISENSSIKGMLGGSYEGYLEEDILHGEKDTRAYSQRLSARGGLEVRQNVGPIIQTKIKGTLTYEADSTNGFPFQHGNDITAPQTTSDYLLMGQAEARFNLPAQITVSLAGKGGKRSPSMWEKFARGPNSDGNEDLLPETRTECELGVIWENTVLSTSISGFLSKTKDKIKWIGRSQNVFTPKNIETVHGKGIEWDFQFAPVPWLMVSNSFTLMKNIIEAEEKYWDNKKEPLLPQVKERNEIKFQKNGFEAGHTFLYSSLYYRGPQNIAFLQPDPEFSLYLRLSTGKHITLTYRLDNYIDQSGYVSNVHEAFERLPKPGRTHYGIIHISL